MKTLILLLICFVSVAQSQDRVDSLRLQLEEVKTKQADLESRLRILEEQSKPENIEKGLAGIGSTKPENLRELKRQEFESQKSSVQKQLALLSDSRTRLEAGLAHAEARAYQDSAKGPAISEPPATTISVKATERPRRAKSKRVRVRRVSK